jgi:integrase
MGVGTSRNKLTDVAIKKAKPTDKPRKLSDGGGLYLQIEPTGGKLWRFDFRFEGKRKTLAVGKYPDVSLQEARRRHREAREQLAQDINPSVAKQARKAAGKDRAANSFEAIAREWFETWRVGKAEHSQQNIIRRLEKDVFPWLGGKPVSEVRAPEVLSVLRRMEDRGLLDSARKCKGAISQIMRYSIVTGRGNRDPVPDLRGALKSVRNQNYPAFTEPAKVGELLRRIDSYKGMYQVRAALRLAPLVFVRPGELRMAKWKDIDLDRAEWRFIASKTGTEHHVPLCRQAVEILRDLHPLTGGGEYVFSGVTPRQPISNNTLNKALRMLGYDTKKDHCAHGFRAMARTMLAERLHCQPDVIELQLAHKAPDRLGTAYNRTKFLPERQKMMEAWADYLDGLKAVAAVLQFPSAG